MGVVVQRGCAVCGLPFDATRPQAKYCGATCRQRARRAAPASPALVNADAGKQPSALSGAGEDIVASVVAELTAAGRQDSAMGVLAVQLAQRMTRFDTGGGLAALSKELRAVMAAALQQAPASSDLIDELKARRDAKRRTC